MRPLKALRAAPAIEAARDPQNERLPDPPAKPTPTPLAPPSAAAIGAANDLCCEFLVEHCELAESYARSAGEAAWRGDRQTIGTHLRQLRLVVIALLQTFKEIADVAAQKKSAA
jgi:hypothetical protein